MKSEVVLLVKTSYYYDVVEWLNYYLKLGFNHITIYDNESSVDISKLCKEYKTIDYYKIYGWPDQQGLYFNHYKHSKYDWVYFADLDEFLWIKPKFKNINEFIEYESNRLNTDFFGIYWIKLSSNPILMSRPDTPKTTQILSFNWKEKIEKNTWLKSFYRTNRPITAIYTHMPYPLLNYKDINNKLYTETISQKFNYKFKNEDAIIFHYYHRSWEEFDYKMKKLGCVARKTTNVEEFNECQFTDPQQYINMINSTNYCIIDNRIKEFLYLTL